MTKPETLFQKILATHTVKRIDADNILLYVDAHFANEYTSPQAFSGVRERGCGVFNPASHLCVVDHIIPSRARMPRVIEDKPSAIQASNLEKNCRDFGIDAFYGTNDPYQGVEHVLMDEQGLVRPGMVVICGDSHTTTHGALGALAFGIGTSEIEHVLATSTLVYRVPKEMLIRIEGELPEGSTAKDLALTVLRKISARGALGHIVTYTGSAVDALSVEGRMTLCNLTVEAGSRGALIAPDSKTLQWVRDHALDMDEAAWNEAMQHWVTLQADAGAAYDKTVTIDASGAEPMITWGTSPDQVIGVSETVPAPEDYADSDDRTAARRAQNYQGLKPGDRLEGLKVDHVYIGSCTNARLADLRAAAEILKGRKVAEGVTAWVVPGSMEVRRQAEKEGIAEIFRAAGFDWRMSGCALCLAMNDDVLAAGVRCASTTNRNFEGRQGRGARTHLVSPQMAAAAAVAGKFVDWRSLK
jgi:3-isopropylmalate/(R)-2-methylmalate dehydratase large subunit